MEKCAVVIPNYKQNLSHNEEISLRQCISVLGQYDIFFISPYGLKNEYNSQVKGVKYYSREAFLNRDSYSKFMLEKTLYEDFIEYDYILIYQLDAFVFRDELKYYCELGYDYIGAPWPYGICLHTIKESKVVYVGNGGFSLRRVQTFIQWTQQNKEEIQYLRENVTNAEDCIIAFISGMNIAPIDIAKRFAVESLDDNEQENRFFGAHNIIKRCYDWARRQYIQYGYMIDMPKDIYIERNIQKKEAEVTKKIQEGCDFAKAIYSCLGTTNVSVWGTGFYGKKIINLCKRYGIGIDSLIESVKKTDHMLGLSVINAEELFDLQEKKRIIVAIMDDRDVVNKLEKHSYRRKDEFITMTDLVNTIYEY